jgi:D-threo-aldose 1-dehydrogenase
VNPLARRPLGKTGIELTQLGFGAGTLGDPYEVTSEPEAYATMAAAYNAGITLFDTAPWYGNTKSEHRVGQYLRGCARDSYVLTTKVGRVYRRPARPGEFSFPRWHGGLHFELRFDYSRDGILRSYEDSLQRLGINTVDALAIHDLDFRHQRDEAGVSRAFTALDSGGGFAALAELRASGEIRAIGAGVNHMGMIPRFAEHFDMDYFLVAMPYTLVDQQALDEEFPLCERRGIGIIIGAPFASGILAQGIASGARYGYQAAGEEVLQRVAQCERVCAAHGVPLGAAALQFPLGHRAVASVIPGGGSEHEVHCNLAWMSASIPAALWSDLRGEGLLRGDAPVPLDESPLTSG